ncbi:MAG: ADP-ribosylglycohydrolase family protein [Armatimonas sp.]
MKSTATQVPPLLLALAIGDAYGAGFEFVPREEVEKDNTAWRYRKKSSNGTRPGFYTDDTQMSLALAEVLAEDRPWTSRTLADRFVTVYHRDPHPGYARGFESILKKCKNGDDFLRLIRPDSIRNGAAMRSLPLGILPTVAKVKEYARIQASLTHNTEVGIASSQAIGLMAHYGLRQEGKLTDLIPFLTHQVPSIDWQTPWSGPVPVDGLATVRAVATLLTAHRSLHELLRASVGLTGDTDTVASLTLGAAVCFPEYRRNLSPALINRLEDSRYGRRYLVQLNKKLFH